MLQLNSFLLVIVIIILNSSIGPCFVTSFLVKQFKFTAKTLSTVSSAASPALDSNSINSGSKRKEESQSINSFQKFDYLSCWYPVCWAVDAVINRPTKVTVFDTDYVISRIQSQQGNISVIAMLDRCPHKSASLSEGRITSQGYFQCAYHGWSFDGRNGQCVEIPQTVARANSDSEDHDVVSSASPGSRACGKAVPAMISQGMIWLFPGGMEAALTAKPPPTVPEIDMKGYKTTPLVRDFPIDYSILLENIMDPDHGLFAHQSKNFDLYSATLDSPQAITEEMSDDGQYWKITSQVEAVFKLVNFNNRRLLRRKQQSTTAATDTTHSTQTKNSSHNDSSKSSSSRDSAEQSRLDVKLSTTTFVAPSVVVMGRRDKASGETSFLTAFWICPVGKLVYHDIHTSHMYSYCTLTDKCMCT